VFQSFKKSNPRSIIMGIFLIAILSLILFVFNANASVSSSGNTKKLKPIVDKIDYPFKNDINVIGLWKVVDFVKNIKDFKPEVKSWKGGDFLSYLKFDEKGKLSVSVNNGSLTSGSYMKWTNGIVIHLGDKTASHYKIQEINKKKYMFWEWKSGDYTIRHMKPYYYVLVKTK
jgi:bla regulator protein BlaR1